MEDGVTLDKATVVLAGVHFGSVIQLQAVCIVKYQCRKYNSVLYPACCAVEALCFSQQKFLISPREPGSTARSHVAP